MEIIGQKSLCEVIEAIGSKLYLMTATDLDGEVTNNNT